MINKSIVVLVEIVKCQVAENFFPVLGDQSGNNTFNDCRICGQLLIYMLTSHPFLFARTFVVRFFLLDGCIQVPQQGVVSGLRLGIVTHADRPEGLVNFVGLKRLVVNFSNVSFRIQLNAIVKLQKSEKFLYDR